MAKFILPYNIPSTPSPFGTAPVGHWGPYSPDPLRRSALRALFFTPQSLRDSPGGALGTVFPRPLASLRSDGFVLGSFWVRLYWYIHLSKSKDFCSFVL